MIAVYDNPVRNLNGDHVRVRRRDFPGNESMMTPEEMRIAIAEKCGWQWYRRPATGPWAKKPMRALYHPSIVPEYVADLQPADMTETQCNPVFLWREGLIPDYPNDLNAMREAEKVLDDETYFGPYTTHLCAIAWTRSRSATAFQRAEAFCRVFWPEKFK